MHTIWNNRKNAFCLFLLQIRSQQRQQLQGQQPQYVAPTVRQYLQQPQPQQQQGVS